MVLPDGIAGVTVEMNALCAVQAFEEDSVQIAAVRRGFTTT